MLTKKDRQVLLDLAAGSIKNGLKKSMPLRINKNDYSEALQANGASFVTLNIDKKLRGCIGCLQAYRPLVEDVVENAFSAAFRDMRFSPLKASEYPHLAYHISILSQPELMIVTSEADLLKQLVPGRDGLIIDDGQHRATFLPSVWETLAKPKEFLFHLKCKAGMASGYWSNKIKVSRYRVEVVE